MEIIPVHRPQLPTFEQIKLYLERIDKARWYSNFGPLANELETRLAMQFNVVPEMLTTGANGTLLLIAILKALNVPQATLCVMPSWTFVATAAAAVYSGLTPYFVDVDQETQALDPHTLKKQLSSINQPIGAVITVAPFGAPIDTKSWDDFTEETKIPVIIDAAAAFDTLGRFPEMRVGKSPCMVSLHATKVLGVGEGGFVASTDADLISRIKSLTGFGFNHNRDAYLLGSNAKLSEYTAAVGLAALDHWQTTRKQWEIARDHYIEGLQKVKVKHCLSSDWVSSTCNVILPRQADTIADYLKNSGIDTRKWWRNGCHQHAAYKHFPRAKTLDNTEWLSQSILGLPFAVDLEAGVINYICAATKSSLEEASEALHLFHMA